MFRKLSLGFVVLVSVLSAGCTINIDGVNLSSLSSSSCSLSSSSSSSSSFYSSSSSSSSTSSSSSSGTIPASGLVAYYPFNGNANDESGNEKDGTVNNVTLTSDRFGANNEAYEFDGSTSYIQTPVTINGSTACTFAAWVNPSEYKTDSGHNQYTIVSQFDGGVMYDLFKITYSFNGSKKFNTEGPDNDKAYSEECVPGNWYFVVGIYDGSAPALERQKIYINGALVSSYYGSRSSLVCTARYLLRIGCAQDTVFNVFKGTIDDVRVYNRALTDLEIEALYHEGE